MRRRYLRGARSSVWILLAIFRGRGVSSEVLELAGGCNTHEEMGDLAKRCAPSGQRVGLLTSAWHLPRAQQLVKKNGLDLIPLPSDFVTEPCDPN